MTPGPDEVKACCAAAYSRDAVALVLGDSYHPGGLALTRTLAGTLDLRPGDRVVDIASGPGTTARLLAAEYGVTVDGVDLGADTIERARAATAGAGLSGQVRFRLGDAERLPLPGASADAVVCECALCTFPDKETAVAEFARVLRPGGRVGLTDVTVEPDRLPEELTTLSAWVSCVAGARPADGYADLFEAAGFRVIRSEPHDDAIVAMASQVDARIRVLRMAGEGRLAESGVDPDTVIRYVYLVRQAVADGALGYSLLVAQKP